MSKKNKDSSYSGGSNNLPSLMNNNSPSYVCENNHRHFLNNNSNNNFYAPKRPLSPPVSESHSRAINGVRMRGLPFSVSENDIRDFFQPLSPISVTLTVGRDGRPSGECECDFGSHSQAVEAMKYDKRFIGSRYVEIFLLSGSSKTPQAQTSFGSLMSKDFSTGSRNTNYKKVNINNYNNNGYTSFESTPLPVPAPPAQIINSAKQPSLLGPLPNASLPANQSPMASNEMIFADMAKQMNHLYNQFHSQQNQQFYPSNNSNHSGTVNRRF